MREIINTPLAPLSASPVSQATRAGNMIFIGGQMPRDLETGRIVDGAEAQARLSLDYCLSILKAAGGSPDTVMLVFCYLTHLDAKPAVDSLFRSYFPVSPPARQLIEVSDIGEKAIVEFAMIGWSVK